MNYHHYELLPEAIHSDDAFLVFRNAIIDGLSNQLMVAVTGPQEDLKDPLLRRRVTIRLAQIGCEIIKYLNNERYWLCIEGGETASAFMASCGWESMEAHYSWKEGTVMLGKQDSSIRILVKPGSYAWPESVFVNN